MDDGVRLFLNKHTHDVLLVHILTEVRTNQCLLVNIYAKMFDMTYEEAVETTQKIGGDMMRDIFVLIAKQGDIAVDGLKESLGL